MDYFSKTEFSKLPIGKRFLALKKDGTYIAARLKGIHSIHLFSYNNFYVEVWIVISLNQVHWIEIQENKEIVSDYAEEVDLNDLGINS